MITATTATGPSVLALVASSAIVAFLIVFAVALFVGVCRWAFRRRP